MSENGGANLLSLGPTEVSAPVNVTSMSSNLAAVSLQHHQEEFDEEEKRDADKPIIEYPRLSTILTHLQSFWSSSYDSTSSLSSYIHGITEKASTLEKWGYSLPDQSIALAILTGLPKEWEPFKNHLAPPGIGMLDGIDKSDLISLLLPERRVLDVQRTMEIQNTNALPLLEHSQDLPIPLELLFRVFDLFLSSGYRMSQVVSLSLVCRRWWNVSRFFQYRCIEFDGPDGYGTIFFNRALMETPIRTYLVQSLSFVNVYSSFYPFIFDIVHGLPALESLDITWKREKGGMELESLIPPPPPDDFCLPKSLKQLTYDGTTSIIPHLFNLEKSPSSFFHSLPNCPNLTDLHVGSNVLRFPLTMLARTQISFKLTKLRIERSPEGLEPDKHSVIYTHIHTLETLFKPSASTLRYLNFCYEIKSLTKDHFSRFISLFKDNLIQLFLVIRDTGNPVNNFSWEDEGEPLPVFPRLEVLRVEVWTSRCTIDLLTLFPKIHAFSSLQILCIGGQTNMNINPEKPATFALSQLLIIPNTISYKPAEALFSNSKDSLKHLQLYDWDIFGNDHEMCARFVATFTSRFILTIKSSMCRDRMAMTLGTRKSSTVSSVAMYGGCFPFPPLPQSPPLQLDSDTPESTSVLTTIPTSASFKFFENIQSLTLTNDDVDLARKLIVWIPKLSRLKFVDCRRSEKSEEKEWEEIERLCKERGIVLGNMPACDEWERWQKICLGSLVSAPIW